MNKGQRKIPVSSRVDVVGMERLVRLWEGKGVNIRSASQLVSWSVDLLIEILENSGELGEEAPLWEAYQRLELRGLMQKEGATKGRHKLSTALGLDNLKAEGMSPEMYAKRQNQWLNNERSVTSAPSLYDNPMIKRAMEIYEGINDEEVKKRFDTIEASDKAQAEEMDAWLKAQGEGAPENILETLQEGPSPGGGE